MAPPATPLNVADGSSNAAPLTGDEGLSRHVPTPAHAASIKRHPSNAFYCSHDCGNCGFQRPGRADIPSAIASLPAQWQKALAEERPQASGSVARLRDELHVVTNRIERLRAIPGTALVAPLPAVTRTPGHRIVNREHLLTLLQLAAERLASIASQLGTNEWELYGRLGSEKVTIEQLALVPLHRSHARLKSAGGCDEREQHDSRPLRRG